MRPAPVTRATPLGVVLLLGACGPADEVPGEAAGDGDPAPLVAVREVFAQVPVVGDVSDLHLLGDEIVLVAGTCGAAEIDLATGEVLAEVSFDLPCPPFLGSRIVDVDGDGSLEFARFSAGWVGPTAVLERDGSPRWVEPTPARCDRLFDVDGDGRLEVLVAEPNSPDVRLLDHAGEVVWSRTWTKGNLDAWPWDVDGDGADELLDVDGEALHVVGRDGRELHATRPPGSAYVNAVRFVTASGAPRDARVLVGDHQHGRQVYHAYGQDVRTYLGTHGRELALSFVGTQSLRRRGATLHAKLENRKKQAWPAGHESSRLRLTVLDPGTGATLEDWIDPEGQELARADGALLPLGGDPCRFLVGYGPTIWKFVLD